MENIKTIEAMQELEEWVRKGKIHGKDDEWILSKLRDREFLKGMVRDMFWDEIWLTNGLAVIIGKRVLKEVEEEQERGEYLVIWDETDDAGNWTYGLKEEYPNWEQAVARYHDLRDCEWCSAVEVVSVGE